MSNWKSAPLTFYKNKITCDETGSAFFDAEVMMDWEDPIMSASSAYITEGGGDILEVGFGMGISANYIQSHNISSHTIIENHPQVIEKAIEWSKDKSNVTIISESWYDVRDSLETYDGILFDTYGDETMFHFSSSLSSWCKPGARVTWWNNEYEANNFYNIPDVTYKEIDIIPEPNNYFTGSKVYYMPMKKNKKKA